MELFAVFLLVPIGVAVIATPILARVLADLPDMRDAAEHRRSPRQMSGSPRDPGCRTPLTGRSGAAFTG